MTDTQPVGPERTGTVIVVSHDKGIAYVREDGTDRRFAISRNFHDAALFGQLTGDPTIDAQGHAVRGKGSRIKFRENGHNCVTVFEILKP